MSNAAVILCAGKGTRMNDDSRNKVAFDCAGVSVIRRIVENMHEGGVDRIVIVVGHLAQTVMEALKGVPGVVYAYQAEQKGTGHAAMCGLKALVELGHDGPAIVSMGDKIVSSSVIHALLEHARQKKAVWGIQPVQVNYNGGRVVVWDGQPCGVVEFADAALMSLADVAPTEWKATLKALRLNDKKAKKVLKLAAESAICGTKDLCGHTFTAEQILATPYANAGLYCFDTKMAIEAISTCTTGNAQGEVYLTDSLEYFAKRNEAVIFPVEKAEDMLTFSTKLELREVGKHFMRRAFEMLSAIESGDMNEVFVNIYGDKGETQKIRYVELLKHFSSRYGNELILFSRSPGRVNLMGRHIDHRGGGINVMTVDSDTVLAVSPRNDDQVVITNTDPAYPERSFSISECLALAKHEDWLAYLEAPAVKAALVESSGDWSNYIKAAVLRFQVAANMPLCGMNIAMSGAIPSAAGLSSSSSIVVATAEAVTALNAMNLTDREFVELCGEGEWFVGSRGGAGDHAAMRCCKRGQITHLAFKPFTIGESVPFPDTCAVIVADSCTKARKSEGSRHRFNAQVATYEFSLMLLKRLFPEAELHLFRDLLKIKPVTKLYCMLRALPEKVTREELLALLPASEARLQELFGTHDDPGVYDLRGVALYGASECARAEMCQEALINKDLALLGSMMKISHDGDRIQAADVSDEAMDRLIKVGAPLYLQPGAYGCSTERIDRLCDLLNTTDGVIGSEIVGAGLGGCVIALVEKERVDNIIERLNTQYYDRYDCPHSATAFVPSSGSVVLF